MARFLITCMMIASFSANILAQASYSRVNDSAKIDFKSVSYLAISSENLSSENILSFENKLDKHIESLSIKKEKTKDDKKFLEYLFYKTHKDYLKKYEKYSDFSTMLAIGNYDCLSGSLLFGYLLDKLGYEYRIVETLYHVYVTVQVNENIYLLESTNPLNGFVSSSKEIEARISLYTNGETLSSDSNLEGISSNEYQFQSSAVANIGLKEAGALQFYNLAIVDFNNQKPCAAYLKLENALQYYPSERIEEMLAVVTQSIAQFDGLPLQEKTLFLQKFKAYHRNKALAGF